MGSGIVTRMKGRRFLLVAGVLGGAAVLFSIFGEVGILSSWRMDRSRRQLAEENARLREDIARLHAEVDRLRTNRAYIEEIARKELGLIGREERVIVLERNQDAPPRHPPPGGPKPR